MAIEVASARDPAWALAEAGEFLASEPVLHNIILTLLHERVAHPEPGTYWVAKDGATAVGVVFQSPPNYDATLTPMTPEAVAAVVDEMSGAGAALPGVSGEAGTAARFAGRWTERQRSAAVPYQGQRIYEVPEVRDTPGVGGHLRKASPEDRELVVSWIGSFQAEIGEQIRDPGPMVDRRLEAGSFWLWDDGGAASLAAESEPVEGVVRVRAAYTPPQRRNLGYAAACVGGLSSRILDDGKRSILYTDLGNPISNPVFRRIGYRAVAEVLRYRFG